MSERNDRPGWGPLIAGLVLLLLGLVSIFDRLEWSRWFDLGRLWPLLVIAIGVAVLAGAGDRRDRRGGLLLVLLGGWFLVNTFELFGLDWGESWPLLLVAIGGSKLVEGGRAAGRGLLLVGLGIWFQVSVLELWGLDLRTSWPYAVIFLGLYLIVTALGFGRRGEAGDSR